MLIRRNHRALGATVAMTPHDVIELVSRIELVIGQAKVAGREQDWPSVYLLLKEALDTVKQLSEEQPPTT
jgi:hypothetical protein